MKNRIIWVLPVLLFLLTLPVRAQIETEKPTSLLVKFSSEEHSGSVINALARSQQKPVNIKTVSSRQYIYKLEYSSAAALSVAKVALENNPAIEMVQLNHKLHRRGGALLTPNDPLFAEQWNLDRIGLKSLWEKTTGGLTPCGDTIVIAVFDFGFDPDHQDMQGVRWFNAGEVPNNGFDDDNNGYKDDYAGLNLDTGNDRHDIDLEYHGTSVSSVITANTNNNQGLAGINWQVKLLILSSKEKDQALAVEAYEYIWALRKKYNDTNGAEGAYIVAVNNSWGQEGLFEEDFQLMCDMYNDLGEVGILSVGSTENDQVNTDVFGDIPSDCSSDYLIIVTNTDRNDELAVGGFGKENVDLGAPGEQIKVAGQHNTYTEDSGTSYAAPHVAGAIGLIYSLEEATFCDNARLEPTQAILNLKRYLLDGVTQVPSLQGRTVSGGRLNLSKTVDMVTSAREVKIDEIRIYPNPVSTDFRLDLPEHATGEIQLQIHDIRGRQVLWLRGSLSEFPKSISTHHWLPGTYILRLKTSRINAYQKVIKL